MSVAYESMLDMVTVSETVSSLANTFGGILLIGVRNDGDEEFPVIEGISRTDHIESEIISSTQKNIYPALIPEVKIIDVPDSNNVVVIVRVHASSDAPYVMRNTKGIIIRTRSVTPPSAISAHEVPDLAIVECLLKQKYTEKLRKRSQQVNRQFRRRFEEKVEHLKFSEDCPHIIVTVGPLYPYCPVISPMDIYNLYKRKYYTRRVAEGVCFIPEQPHKYTELNEYGIVCRRDNLGNSEQGIEYETFLLNITETILLASELYEKCGYLGDIMVSVELKQVSGKELRMGQDIFGHGSKLKPCLDLDIRVLRQCYPNELHDTEERGNIVEDLTFQLLWAFNVSPPKNQGIREGIAYWFNQGIH